jgi:NADH-quinone oxidoreductase subunit H
MSSLWTILFLGGWDLPLDFLPDEICFGIKVVSVAYLFILVRAILPRFRYDKLIELG